MCSSKLWPVVETRAYQVTIPASVCEEIGLHEGDTLEAKVEDGHIVLIPNSAEHSTSPKNMQMEGRRFGGWRPIGAKTRKNVIPLPIGLQSPLVILQTINFEKPNNLGFFTIHDGTRASLLRHH